MRTLLNVVNEERQALLARDRWKRVTVIGLPYWQCRYCGRGQRQLDPQQQPPPVCPHCYSIPQPGRDKLK